MFEIMKFAFLSKNHRTNVNLKQNPSLNLLNKEINVSLCFLKIRLTKKNYNIATFLP